MCVSGCVRVLNWFNREEKIFICYWNHKKNLLLLYHLIDPNAYMIFDKYINFNNYSFIKYNKGVMILLPSLQYVNSHC